MFYYAGIGSRETPDVVLSVFRDIAKELSADYILRSGGADGADTIFEKGVDEVHGKKEIYLPWKGFNHSTSSLIVSEPEAFQIAEKYHPYWNKLKDGAKKLQARNSHQVLGADLKTPSSFVVCWTENGSGKGGTGQAIRIANAYHVPVFDAGKYSDLKKFKKDVLLYAEQCINNKNNKLNSSDIEFIIYQLHGRIQYCNECIKAETKKRPSNADKIIYYAELKKKIEEMIRKLEMIK